MNSFDQTNPVKNIHDLRKNIGITKEKIILLDTKIKSIVKILLSLLPKIETVTDNFKTIQSHVNIIKTKVKQLFPLIISVLENPTIKLTILQILKYIIIYFEYQIILNKIIYEQIKKLDIIPKYYNYLININKQILQNVTEFRKLVKSDDQQKYDQINKFINKLDSFDLNSGSAILLKNLRLILPYSIDDINEFINKNVDINKYGDKIIEFSDNVSNKIKELQERKKKINNMNKDGIDVMELLELVNIPEIINNIRNMNGGGKNQNKYNIIQDPFTFEWIPIRSYRGLYILDKYLASNTTF